MIEVFDNLLSTFQIDKLRKEALKQQNWVDGINTPYLKDIKLPQFTLPEIYLTPDLRNILFSLLNEIHIKIPQIKLDNLLRLKINKLSPLKSKIEDKYGIHIDRWDNHYSIIYYINDSDGDTIFYSNTLGDQLPNWTNIVSDKNLTYFNEIKRVKPKKGRAVVFKGDIFHNATYPLNGDRYVANFNIAEGSIKKTLT
tara:strand:- start:8083 stop:8673 length:591 start_codon:yes stop_codon:yes gene_type:complete